MEILKLILGVMYLKYGNNFTVQILSNFVDKLVLKRQKEQLRYML